MGIGLFVLGQSISYVRRAGSKGGTRDNTSEQSFAALMAGLRLYKRSFTRFVSSRSVLIHPEVLKLVDEDLWVDRINRRATVSWWTNLISMPLAGFVGILISIEIFGAEDFFPVTASLLGACFGFWFLLKYTTLFAYVRRIDRSFSKRGFDIEKIKPEARQIVRKMIADQRELDRKHTESSSRSREKKKQAKLAESKQLFGQSKHEKTPE